jgi:hypothetical protein
MSIRAEGKFEVQAVREPPFEVGDEGVSLARATITKTFTGELEAKSTVHMLGASTTVQGTAAYVALERVVGRLGKRSGSFVFQHSAWMRGGESHLSLTVVPDSGTGELRGLSGEMSIKITDGQHFYAFDYLLPRD